MGSLVKGTKPPSVGVAGLAAHNIFLYGNPPERV